MAVSAGCVTFAGAATAGPWNIEPSVGALADYETNPGLHTVDIEAEEHVAAIADIPLRYDVDGIELTLHPSGRLSNSTGYNSLASNYLHIDAGAQFNTALSTTTLQGEWARDSSLYFVGGLDSGFGVRRDTGSTTADWTRYLSARAQIALDGSWTETRFSQPPDLAGALIDYRYLSAGPTWSYLLTERDTLKVLGSVGQYQSLNGITESKSYNLQLGYVRQLSEVWTLNATAGYARAINSEKIFYGPYFLGSFKTNEDSGVYSATLTRQSERFNVNLGVTRALQPTGLAYLAQVQSISAALSFKQSERWDYTLTASWQKALDPVLRNAVIDVRYFNAQLAANWHWTEQWVLTLNLGRISQQYTPPPVNAASFAVTLGIVRHFPRTEL